jgi:alpha-L-rhamnosidase
MKIPGNSAFALGLIFFLAANLSSPAADSAAWPPITSQARPWTWWWWHGSAVDETNLARELHQFHDAGLGGVQITTIYGVQGAEARDIPYLTPEWMKMMGYTVDEAQRFGLGVDMTLGSGWCFGGPTVSDQDANASVVVKTYDVAAGGKLAEKFNRDSTQALVAFSADGKLVELTKKISADGEVDWTAPTEPTNSWTVYAISQKPSGQKVKRAAPGGEGWMLNPLYPQAMRDWLKWFDAALANYNGPKPCAAFQMKGAELLMTRSDFNRPEPQAVFQDSYEYRTDWSPDFLAQFEKLRGYKLQDELPALFSGTDIQPVSSDGGARGATRPTEDEITRVKYDYRRTVSEIMAGQSEPIWIDWAHRHGFQTIYQAHGTPGNWLDLYGDADIPETEMFHNDRSILISKFASSAAHTQGRPLTGAETGTWLEEHFTVTLADLKHLADDMFLAGVNHIYYHGTCYSPEDAPWPGWLFYASTEMNPRNSIWHDVPTLNNYIARCQSVLQSGKPDSDILLYWPVADFWSNPNGLLQPMAVGRTAWFEDQPIGKIAHELWDHGYAFDYVSDAQLLKAKIVDGKIRMPGGDYKVIVVPQCKYMPLEIFKQMLALAEGGALVVFKGHLPGDVPGLANLASRRNRFKKLCEQLEFGTTDLNVPIAATGKGYVLIGKSDDRWYAHLNTRGEMMVGEGLSYIRRSFAGGWHYFIANRGKTNFDGWITLARPAKSGVILDPMTATSGVAAQSENAQFHLHLAAGQSLILRAFDHPLPQLDSLPAWNYFQTKGTPAEITGTWNVKFVAGGPTLPADFQTPKLTSWTTFSDNGVQAFAGTARYEITFDAPNAVAKDYYLNLGTVCQSARVTLNGKAYGTLIIPPFRVVVDNLKPTGNKLEVEVTNVAANRIRDLDRRGVKWKIFKDINIVNINYRPFDAADWPLTDSGLLGPVTLTPITAR